jgi:tetratricopeptide (TPR) repeat protein
MTRHNNDQPKGFRSAAAVLLLAAGVTLCGCNERQRAEQQAEAARQRKAVEEALARAQQFQQHARWAEARAALELARDRLGDTGPEDLRQRVDQAAADLAMIDRLEAIRLRRPASADRDYGAALREAGLNMAGKDAAAVADRIRASAAREQLVAALDDWAAVTTDRKIRAWLLDVARQADPDPLRDRLRDPKVWENPAALEKLAGEVLRDQGNLAKLRPELLAALGQSLLRAGADAVPLLRAAQQQHPGDFWQNLLLGQALADEMKWDEAIGYYRAALALRPDSPAVHLNLGNALRGAGRRDEAVRAYRAAIALDPRNGEAYRGLGLLLRSQGKYPEALAALRQGHRLSNAFAALVRQTEQMAALADRLPAILKGDAKPGDAAERLLLAQMCSEQDHHAAAARFWADAFAADAKLADDLNTGNRSHAARDAALASSGKGQDVGDLDAAGRTRWRRQALAWLRADLALWQKRPQGEDRTALRQALWRWQRDPTLAGVRDPAALAVLPEAERDEWRRLWAEVTELQMKLK